MHQETHFEWAWWAFPPQKKAPAGALVGDFMLELNAFLGQGPLISIQMRPSTHINTPDPINTHFSSRIGLQDLAIIDKCLKTWNLYGINPFFRFFEVYMVDLTPGLYGKPNSFAILHILRLYLIVLELIFFGSIAPTGSKFN